MEYKDRLKILLRFSFFYFTLNGWFKNSVSTIQFIHIFCGQWRMFHVKRKKNEEILH